MEKTWDTDEFGEVTLRGAMLDTNGTDLVDGIEILIDGELRGEIQEMSFSRVEDLTVDEVEELIEFQIDFKH